MTENIQFDAWNHLKKKVHSDEQRSLHNFPKEQEVWMCMIGKNIGFEQNRTESEKAFPGQL